MPYIYALRNKTTDLVYYGSTKETLNARFRKHKSERMYYLRGGRPYATTSYQILDCPTAYIELVEEVSEEDKSVREKWWIQNNTCVNKFIPLHDRKEYCRNYYLAHQEEIKARSRAYRQEH